MTLTPIRLRVNHKVAPLGLDTAAPRLSWWVTGEGQGRTITAAQVLVATTPNHLAQDDGNVWDSGRLDGVTSHITYAGSPLPSRQRCCWKVRVWDEGGRPGPWSDVSTWEMGLLTPGDWQATWVEHEVWSREDRPRPVPLMRRTFRLDAPVRSARLYVTALGLYEARLNGQRVGDALLAPGWTDYHTRVLYQTYDVTSLLQEGDNALGAVLGDGWYCGYVGFRNERRHYGPRPRFLAQLEVHLDTGARVVVTTDGSWTATTGPVRASDLLMGETYDARAELPGWDLADYDDSAWSPVVTTRWHGTLTADAGPPIRALATLKPAQDILFAPGVRIFDLGQNIVGWVRVRVRGEAGARVTLRFAEMLRGDGALYTEALRSAAATDTYVCKGDPEEVFEPRFTFHGFRFVEVVGDAQLLDLHGVVVGSDTPQAGTFACSDPNLNQLQSNIDWSRRGNFLSVPTDCPQRDERLGWLGDAQVFAPTALLNADCAAFFSKWMQDVLDAQSPAGAFPDVAPRLVTEQDGAPGWGDAGVIVPWTLWRYGGDLSVAQRAWTAMTRWMTYIGEANPEFLWLRRRGNDYGDWLAQDGDDPKDGFGSRTPKDLVATAFWAHDARLMAEMAAALGRREEARAYRVLFERICVAFQTAYLEENGWLRGRTQTGQTLALRFGLLSEHLRPSALARLVDLIEARGDHLTTGFLGVAHLLPVLAEGGRADIAQRLLARDTFPSWLFSVRQGATTIWERWDGFTHERGFGDPNMNSFNHYSLGSVGQWLFEGTGGLLPLEAGFTRVRIAPQPGPLAWARVTHDAPTGHFEVEWRKAGDTFELDVVLPVGVTAEVLLPEEYRSAETVQVLGSGRHALVARAEVLI
ncbi:family 78 glycoside hydrolase catalytic domain [Deinococcus sp. YIM 134068]|uniref:family 78 glycoside hydrolase catalytic domain n=1 Tax=Deinococcus lichenicola TaxID=3118910 RepID=UPI002F931E90